MCILPTVTPPGVIPMAVLRLDEGAARVVPAAFQCKFKGLERVWRDTRPTQGVVETTNTTAPPPNHHLAGHRRDR